MGTNRRITRDKLITATGLGLLMMLFVHGAGAQQTIKLTFASGFPPVLPFIVEAEQSLLPAVNDELAKSGNKYKVEWNIAVGGTLAKIPAMLQATSEGLADLSALAPIFEPGKLPLQNVGLVAPFTAPNHRIATQVMNDLHRNVPAMMKAWDAQNLVFLMALSADPFALFTKFPVNSLADLKGKKIAAGGQNLNWLKNTGAVGVVTNLATLYNDLQAGIADGTTIFPISAASIKLNEVAPYLTRVSLGSVSTFAFAINKTRWEKLPPEVQTAIRKATDRMLDSYLARMDRLYDQSFQELVKGGAKITTLSREENLKWVKGLPALGLEWVKEMEAKGLPGRQVMSYYMDFMRKNKVEIFRDWDRE